MRNFPFELPSARTILISGISIILGTLIYNLVLPPQSWTLNNDYGMLRTYGVPGFDWWKSALGFIESMKSDGRFMPVFAFTLMPRYAYLPLFPEVFRLVQLAILIGAVAAFYQFMTLLKLEKDQKILAVFVALMSFVTKEWLLLTAASEPLATLFFFSSLVLYLRGLKVISALIFALSFLSKESFFILAPVFLILDLKRPSKNRWIVSLLVLLEVGLFLFFIKSLPRKYTAGHFDSMSFLNCLKALILPPIKSFGSMMILLLFAKPSIKTRIEFWIGVTIVFPFSILLVGWGAYDSWTYLQAIIPFGWALIFASIWPIIPKKEISVAATALGVIYATYTTANGSLNWWRFLEGGKQAASKGCEYFKSNPSVSLFMNCDEGASQLSNYLFLSGKCVPEPKIKYFKNAEEVMTVPGPKYVLYANKYCPKSSLPPNPVSSENYLTWTVYSYD